MIAFAFETLPYLQWNMDRRTLIAVIVVADLIVVAIVLWFLWPRVFGDTTQAEAALPLEERPPAVLLIPGYGGGADGLVPLSNVLRQQGIRTEIVDFGDGRGDLSEYGADVARQAQALQAQGYDVDLVGYSAGGITARSAAQQAPEAIDRIVTIGSPHNGTVLASLGGLVGACPIACQQMQPDSDLLTALPAVDGDFLSVYSENDDVIRPFTSSELDGATNVLVQDACSSDTVEHGGLPNDGYVQRVVAAFLTDQPVPTTC